MRRWLAPLIAAVALALPVIGCGGDDDDGAPPTSGFTTVEEGVLTVGSDIPVPPLSSATAAT